LSPFFFNYYAATVQRNESRKCLPRGKRGGTISQKGVFGPCPPRAKLFCRRGKKRTAGVALEKQKRGKGVFSAQLCFLAEEKSRRPPKPTPLGKRYQDWVGGLTGTVSPIWGAPLTGKNLINVGTIPQLHENGRPGCWGGFGRTAPAPTRGIAALPKRFYKNKLGGGVTAPKKNPPPGPLKKTTRPPKNPVFVLTRPGGEKVGVVRGFLRTLPPGPPPRSWLKVLSPPTRDPSPQLT